MSYAVGHNLPGYLPDDISVVATFDEAKAMLIHDLKHQENYADDDDTATDFCHAAEDVNLWSGPDSIVVDGEAWWIDHSEEEPGCPEIDGPHEARSDGTCRYCGESQPDD